MQRNIEKLINESNKKFFKNEKEAVKIYVSELQEIKDMSADTYDLIHNSILFGLMLGYKFAKKESQKAQTK